MNLFQIGEIRTRLLKQKSQKKVSFLSKNKSLSYCIANTSVQKNHNNYIISLANLCRWLASEAENLGVEIFSGFAASQIYSVDNSVIGVQTGDMNKDKDGNKKDSYEPGININAKVTVLPKDIEPRKELIKNIIYLMENHLSNME